MEKIIVKSDNILGYEKIPKLIYKFSVPAIIGMTINALYNVVDRIFIGNSPDLGANGLAAITICFPAMIIIMAIGILLGQGGATLFAISLGKKDHNTARMVLGNATFVSVFLGIIIGLLGEIFIDDILILFGASENILVYAREYMRIIFLGTLFQIVTMTMNNFLRADGKPKLSMMTMFLSAGINIVLDPIFIYGFRMGMTGAAIATVFSMFISTVWSLYHFLKKSSVNRITKENFKFDLSLTLKIFALGAPGFFVQIVGGILNLLLNHTVMKYGGDIAVSGIGIVASLQTLMILPIIGLNQGLQPIVSFNYGAQKMGRVKDAVMTTIVIATVFSVIGFLLSHLIPNLLVSMFNREEKLMNFGVHALKTWLLFMPIIGFQIVGSNFFQAIGKPRMAMFLTLTRQVLVLIPSIIIFSRIWQLDGVLYSAPFADLVSSTVTAIFFFPFIKKISKKENATKLEI